MGLVDDQFVKKLKEESRYRILISNLIHYIFLPVQNTWSKKLPSSTFEMIKERKKKELL